MRVTRCGSRGTAYALLVYSCVVQVVDIKIRVIETFMSILDFLFRHRV
jgi:hypothetical protein